VLARELNAISVLPILAIVGLLGFTFEANSQPALPPIPGLGAYGDLLKNTCGKQGVKWNPEELPWIGCFGLSSSRSASGTIDEHKLVVSVNSGGNEVCTVDGITVDRTTGNKTNVPGLFYGPCHQLYFCTDQAGLDCVAFLEVISRNDDKSIYFYIARRVARNLFVTNQENWNYEHRDH
jgi:hypothetical protein